MVIFCCFYSRLYGFLYVLLSVSEIIVIFAGVRIPNFADSCIFRKAKDKLLQ